MADKRISQLIERVDIANNDVLPIVASGATTTNKVTVSTLQDWMQDNLDVGVTSVGLSMPSAFVVSNSPVTGSGNISVTGAGTVSQYIRGDGSLADFPSGGGGGGSSVNYYLNGSVSQGTIGGIAYKEMNKVPVLGAGTDFVAIADGYLASFITDAGDPALLEIPAGNWNFETYFSASSGGGTPSFYVELYKVDIGGTATLIASNSGTPELIAFGTTITPYFSTLAVPTTSLTLTDRLALRYYVARSGRTITLHTENSHLCQIITTFTTGLTALNSLTAQVQNFATGTSGTNFGISSTGSTHTFNLPTASATNRGALSSADWSSFNGKVPYTGAVANVDLGVYSITASAINSTGSGSVAGQINLRSDAFFTLVNGYGSIASGTTNQFNLYQTTGAGVFRGAILSLNSITASATRTYTLPDTDGTLALTSQIPANIVTGTGGQGRVAYWDSTGVIKSDPVFQYNDFSKRVGIGRTPTVSLDVEGAGYFSGALGVGGALNGTSAVFSGNAQVSKLLLGTSTANSYRINLVANSDFDTAGILLTDTNTGGRSYAIGSSITTIGSLEFRDNTAGQNRLTISSTGAATFSSSVSGSQFVANGNSAGGFEGLRIVNASTGAAQIALNNSAQSWLVNTRTDNQFSIFNSTASTTPLLISTTGAATFSSSVTAIGLLQSNDRLYMPGNQPIANWFSSSLSAGYSSSNGYGWVNGAGNLVLGTNGSEKIRVTGDGLTFNGDTAAANALDDYEEGTWTPEFIGGGGTATYYSRRGWYTKIGRQVTIVWQVSFQKGAITSSLGMSGLPFVVLADSSSFYPQGTVLLDNLLIATNNITFQVANGSTQGDFIGGNGGTTGHTGLSASSLGMGTMMCRGTATYFV